MKNNMFGLNNKEYKVSIEGMRCKMCAANVEKTLKALKNVKKVEVNLEEKFALVTANAKDEEAFKENVKASIKEIGFEVTNIE